MGGGEEGRSSLSVRMFIFETTLRFKTFGKSYLTNLISMRTGLL
jgi:hypothetical protein